MMPYVSHDAPMAQSTATNIHARSRPRPTFTAMPLSLARPTVPRPRPQGPDPCGLGLRLRPLADHSQRDYSTPATRSANTDGATRLSYSYPLANLPVR